MIMGVPLNSQEFDLYTTPCNVQDTFTIPPVAIDGSWCVAVQSSIHPNFVQYPDAFTLELSDSLTIGNWYEVSFYHHKGTGVPLNPPPYIHDSARGEIGISLTSGAIGDSLFTSTYSTNTWAQESFVFQASTAAKHLYYKGLREPGIRWTIVDHFEIREVEAPPPSSIEEYNSEPKLLRVVDMLGRKSAPKPNTPLFYIYGDGTVEKRITIE
jgi:hypothetical protein